MDISVKDVCDKFVEPGLQKVGIFDLKTSKEVYSGPYDEMPDDYEGLEVQSIDLTGEYGSGEVIVFNVEVE